MIRILSGQLMDGASPENTTIAVNARDGQFYDVFGREVQKIADHKYGSDYAAIMIDGRPFRLYRSVFEDALGYWRYAVDLWFDPVEFGWQNKGWVITLTRTRDALKPLDDRGSCFDAWGATSDGIFRTAEEGLASALAFIAIQCSIVATNWGAAHEALCYAIRPFNYVAGHNERIVAKRASSGALTIEPCVWRNHP